MLNKAKHTYYRMGAAMMTGMLAFSPDDAHAGAAGKTFTDIAKNITTSIEGLPGFLTAISYMFGILLGVLGVLKIKDHVENPSQTPLKDGAIRLAAGGALFALPIIFEAMLTTVGDGDADVQQDLKKIRFGVN